MIVNLREHVGSPLTRPITIAIAGAGSRGAAYAEYIAKRPDRAKIVAVAETREDARKHFADQHGLGPDAVFTDWREMAARGRIADAVVVATLDAEHVAPATVFAHQGYDILLEKPIAPDKKGTEAVARVAARTGVVIAVCHVLRYTPYTRAVREHLPELGELIGIEHLEPVGSYHFAHSFVRGNWRNTKEASFSLLTKSCHDIDWLCHLVGRPVTRTTSFGRLAHFHPGNRPPEAADRCLDCPLRDTCAYSATTIYGAGLREPGPKQYFTGVITRGELTDGAVTRALSEGPYGRCVYACDNDVADHQVTLLEFEGGVTASFTMSAFTPLEDRRTRIFGTRGHLTGDGRYVHVYDFRTEKTTTTDTAAGGPSVADGHGGGDEGLIESFVDALFEGRPDLIRSGIAESVESHRVVFAAERARLDGSVVTLT